MFNFKLDWKVIAICVALTVLGYLTWSYISNSEKVKTQAETISQLESTITENKRVYDNNVKTLTEFNKTLTRTVEIERGYNENLKTLEKVITGNNSVHSSMLLELTDLRKRNSETPVDVQTYIRRIDVLSRSLEKVSGNYEGAATDHSRARLEFYKCKAYLDEIYKLNKPDKKE